MSNPYMKRLAVARIGDSGRSSEKRLAKTLSARARPASGAVPGQKGDLVLPDVLMECKSTVGRSIGVKHAWLSKIKQEALAAQKRPALALSFVDAQGKPVRDGDWVCIPMALWRELIDP